MTNFEKREVVIARLLDLLIDLGIQRGAISFADLNLDDSYFEFFVRCASWLQDEGIIRYNGVSEFLGGGPEITDPVLTAFGLSALGKELKVAGKTISLRGAVREVSENRRSYSQFGDLVGGFLGGFTKSISS